MANNFLVLDTETTGLEWYDQVVELAIIDSSGKPVYESLFKPDVPMSDGARAVNKISDEALAKSPRLIDEWSKIYPLLAGQNVVGHNIINFDIPMIERTLAAQGQTCELAKALYPLDTLLMVKRMGMPRKSQQYLLTRYGISTVQTHRALDDCTQLLHIFKSLVREYRCKNPKATGDDLWKMLTPDKPVGNPVRQTVEHTPFVEQKANNSPAP